METITSTPPPPFFGVLRFHNFRHTETNRTRIQKTHTPFGNEQNENNNNNGNGYKKKNPFLKPMHTQCELWKPKWTQKNVCR